MRFLQEGNFNGLIFRDGMVFISDIDRWVTKEEYEKYKNNMNKGIIRVQKQLLVIEAIATDRRLNDTEKIEQIKESINQYYE